MAIRQDKTQEFEYGSLARCRGDTRTVVFQVFPVTQVVFQNFLVIFLVGLDPCFHVDTWGLVYLAIFLALALLLQQVVTVKDIGSIRGGIGKGVGVFSNHIGQGKLQAGVSECHFVEHASHTGFIGQVQHHIAQLTVREGPGLNVKGSQRRIGS